MTFFALLISSVLLGSHGFAGEISFPTNSQLPAQVQEFIRRTVATSCPATLQSPHVSVYKESVTKFVVDRQHYDTYYIAHMNVEMPGQDDSGWIGLEVLESGASSDLRLERLQNTPGLCL